MSHWQAPFRILRDQFLAAARENFRVNFALASFPDHASYSSWYDRTINADLSREATNPMNREPGNRTRERAVGTVWGQAEGVQRFESLAKEAGNSLPFDFHPAQRLFPWFNELSNVNPGPTTLWSEFLFVARTSNFHVQEDHPTPGCRIARLEGDPFLASATAIEQFLLSSPTPNLDEYFQRMRAVCPWLTNAAGGFPTTPPGASASPFLQFDLVRVFQGAVELGAALATRDTQESTQLSNETEDFTSRFLAGLEVSRAVEVASDRLVCALNPRLVSVREWSRQVDFADASLTTRQALLTLGLAVADIRGDWEERGRELLSGGAWHLWDGMGTHDRRCVRSLLADTHCFWGWPTTPQDEPGEYTGPRATLADPRVIDQSRWRTTRADYLNEVQAMVSRQNVLADTIRLPGGGYFDIYRDDVKATRFSLPSVCPHADPKPPVELRADGDLLADLENRFRDLGIVGPDESLHWVGRQDRRETRCRCELAPAAFYQPRPAEWRTLRDMRAALVGMMKVVGLYVEGRGAGQVFPREARATFDVVAERVYGLAQSLGIPLPPVVANPNVVRVHPHGPTALPVYELAEGLIISEADGRQWLSNWRAVRVGIDARLAQLDRAAQPGADADGVDTRDYPLDAPSGTPSPLREAFEAVARALFEAAEFHREPPTGGILFRELAGGLASRVNAADRHYTGAELQLQAVTDAQGCAHRAALAAVRRVNDAAGHVILGSVSEHMAVAHLRQVPAPDVAGLLLRMRQQVSRAAQSAGTLSRIAVTNATQSGGTPSNPALGVVPPDEDSLTGRAAGTASAELGRGVNPAVDETELTVLTELRSRHPVLVKNVDIEAATNLSKQTVSKAISGLVGKRLVARPQGERKGATVTPNGIALLDGIRKSSADHP